MLMNGLYLTLTNSKQNPTTYTYFNLLTRADFWMLCEQRALAYGYKNDPATATFKPTINSPNGFTFYYGRPTTEPYDADPYEGTLPDGSDSWETMLTDIQVGLNNTVT